MRMFGSTPRCGKSIGLYWNEVKMSEKYTYRGSTVYEHGEELSTIDIVDLLNNQQALINALKKENKKLKEELEKGFDVPIPYVENSLRRLRAEHKVDEQQATIDKLRQRYYYNQSERYKILGRAIELAADYIHRNDLGYYDFCGLVTEFEEELLEGVRRNSNE